jgi:hypothetical protein
MVRMVAIGFSNGSRLPSSCSIRYPIIPSVCAPRTSNGYADASSYDEAWRASRPTCGPLPWEITSSCSWATGASDRQAVATLARCRSTVIGSPLRCRAFPPSATTILMVPPQPAAQPPIMATRSALMV